MNKKLIFILIIGLLMTGTISSIVGASESKKQSVIICGNGDYNLAISISSDRLIFPRVYAEGTTAMFLVKVTNEGPNTSEAVTVNGTITRIIGKNHGESIPFSWVVDPLKSGIGLGKLTSSWCNNQGAFFGVFKIQATININDSNLNDNTASFLFISLTIPRKH